MQRSGEARCVHRFEEGAFDPVLSGQGVFPGGGDLFKVGCFQLQGITSVNDLGLFSHISLAAGSFRWCS